MACLATGAFMLSLGAAAVQTMAVVTLVFSGQAVLYVARERRHVWSSWPGRWLIASSVAEVGIIVTLARRGVLMAALPPGILAGLFVAAVAFTFVLDAVKLAAFRRLQIA